MKRVYRPRERDQFNSTAHGRFDRRQFVGDDEPERRRLYLAKMKDPELAPVLSPLLVATLELMADREWHARTEIRDLVGWNPGTLAGLMSRARSIGVVETKYASGKAFDRLADDWPSK